MRILDYFRPNKKLYGSAPSASIAKERLQIIVSHKRKRNPEGQNDLIQELTRKIIDMISEHLNIKENEFSVDLSRDSDRARLELNVTLPDDV